MRIVRYGSVGMRLVESGPTLEFVDRERLVAVSEGPFAQRVPLVFELIAALPGGEGAEPFPTTHRHVGPRLGPYAVIEGEIVGVIADEPTKIARMAIPDLSVRERRDARGEIVAVAATRRGDRIVVGLASGEIVRLDPDGGRAVLARASSRPTAIAFAPSGDRVAVGTEGGVVEVVWVAGVRVLTTLRGGRAPVTRLLFSPDEGSVIASTGRELHQWSVRGGAAASLALAKVGVDPVGFTQRGLLVTNWAQEQVAAIDLATRRIVWRVEAYGPCAVDGERVFSARFEALRQIDGSSGAIVRTVEAAQFVDAVVPVPGRDLVIVALATGNELRVADLATGEWSGGAGGHETDITTVQFCGDRLVTGGKDTRACVWELERSRPRVTAIAPSGYAREHCGAVFLDEERGMLWAAFGDRVTLCNLEDGGCERDSQLLGAPVTLVRPIRGTSLVVACTEPKGKRYGSLVLLDAASLQPVHTERIDRSYRRLRLRADGRLRLDGALGWGVYDLELRAFVERGIVPSRDPSREHHRSADDGLLVEVANRPSPEGGLRGLIWVTELPAQWTLIGGLETVAFSGRSDLSLSGRYLATPHTDGRVRVWDVEDGECVLEWDVGEPLASVWFFPDEWRVLGSTADGRLLQISEIVGGSPRARPGAPEP